MCIRNYDLTWRCSAYGIFNLETIIRKQIFEFISSAKVVTQLYKSLKTHVLLEDSYDILGLRDLIYK